MNDSGGHAAGDALIQRTASVLARNAGEQPGQYGEGGGERLRAALEAEGIAASTGSGFRHPKAGLLEAWKQGDEAMFAEKRLRKGNHTEVTLTRSTI